MFPELVRVGSFSIYSYGLLIAIGCLVGTAIGVHRAPQVGLERRRVLDLCFWGVVAGLVGAKLFSLWENRSLDLANAGLVFWGGVVGGVAGLVVACLTVGAPFWRVADLLMPPLILGLGFGRVGCFLAGCCWGVPTDLFVGVTFPNSCPAGRTGAAVHPTQLYEAAACAAIFFLLSAIWRRQRQFEGRTFWWGVVIYSVWRFPVEFIRGDNPPYWPLGLTFSQGLCVLGVLLAAVFLIPRRASNKI